MPLNRLQLCAVIHFEYFAALTPGFLYHGVDVVQAASNEMATSQIETMKPIQIKIASIQQQQTIIELCHFRQTIPFTDRIGGRRAYQLCFVPLIASLLSFIVIKDPWMLLPAIVVYGFAHGGFFTIVAPTVAEFFGTRAHGVLFGVILFCGTLGGAIGPIAAGWVFDTQGSYDAAFGGLAAFAALGLLLVLTLPRGGVQAAESTV